MCPMSSVEIAQVNGAFQQAAMQRMQYGSAIGQGDVYGGGFQSGMRGEAVMAGAMNRASAVGAPMLTGAAALAGLDPMSAGLTAAWSARGLGFAGAAGAGMAAAMPLMAAGAAASYAGGQMMEGASQQSGLNQTLRGAYNFRNRQGGSGFDRSEMSSIGTMIRDMSGQFGPGGEVVGFRELTQLAGKMTTMGLAQGVKDVKDFAERFKHMVTSLKTMATDLGTTLEGAMEFAASAKQSGVFGMKGATMFSAQVRSTAVAGGLAMSEVTGAASIGSQIVRSIGGLGKQGAGAGMRTIGQIGTAVQMGALSEEDIYNVTGQTGAEGRQAYATSQMSKTASFLQSGRGRLVLASMAGKDGTLDEGAVQEFLSGGMSIQEPKRLGNKVDSTVGRANFIRNEGRLRGAAMERLGAFLPAIQMQQWAASKGIDINDMDDRSMLFAQRQLGMGRDEVDQAIKMANAMPRIMEEQRRSDIKDTNQQQFAMMAKGRGLEGIKTRFNQAQEEINSKVQKAGQEVYNQGSEWVEGLMNRMLGVYVQNMHKDVDGAFQDMLSGGRGGKAAAQRVFGVGNTGRFAKGAADMGLGGFKGEDLATRMNQGSSGDSSATIRGLFGSAWKGGDIGPGNALSFLLHGQSGVGQMKEAGFDISNMNSKEMAAKFADISKMQSIAAQYAATGKALGSDENSKWIRDAYSTGKPPEGGDERMAWFGGQLKKNNPAMAAKWNSGEMSQADKVAYMSLAEARAGIQGGGALAARYGVPEKLMGVLANIHGEGFHTTGDMNTAYAKALGYESDWDKQQANPFKKQANLFGLDKAIYNLTHGGEAAKAEAKGAFARGEEFRDLAQELLSSDTTVVEKAQARLGAQLGSISKDGRTAADDVKEDMLKASMYAQMKDKGASKEQLEAFAKEKGTTTDALESFAQGMVGVVSEEQRANRRQAAKTYSAAGREELASAARAGIYDARTDSLTSATHDKLMKSAGSAGVALAMSGVTQANLQSQLSGGDEDAGVMDRLRAGGDQQAALMDKMTVPQLRAVAAAMAGTPIGSIAGREAAMETKLAAGNRRGGGNKTIAAILGVKMEKGDIGTQEGADRIAELYVQSSGIKEESTIKMIHEAVNAARTGDVKGEAKALRGITESDDYAKANKEKTAAADEARNPTQAAIKANTEQANKFLELIAKHAGVTSAEITALNDKTKAGDPEGGGTSQRLGSHTEGSGIGKE